MRAHGRALIDALRERGWTVTVAGPAGVLDDVDVVVHVGRPAAVGRARSSVRRAVRHRGVDLVHAHGLTAGWLAALSGRERPVVVTAHNVVLADRGVRRRLEAALPGRVDAVIATSRMVAERLGTDCVIPPFGPPPDVRVEALAVRASLGIGAHRPLVVTVARLHPQKGLETLLDAAVALRRLVPGVAVVIVGGGPMEVELRRRILELGVDDVVILAGPRPHAVDELGAADVVAIPSVWESGPLVATEALSLGRAVVSTPVGFVPDLAAAGASVRLVPIGDAAALAAALAEALTERRDGAAFALEPLAVDRLIPAVEAVYAQVLAR